MLTLKGLELIHRLYCGKPGNPAPAAR